MTIDEIMFLPVKCEGCKTPFGPLFQAVDKHYNRLNVRLCRRCLVMKLALISIPEVLVDKALLNLPNP